MRREHEQVRTLATWALVKIGPPAVGPLVAALWDTSTNVRAAAAQALGEIGDPQATPSLIAAQDTENTEVRKAIAAALVKIGSTPDSVPSPAPQ
jgi:HEAT repeat protein